MPFEPIRRIIRTRVDKPGSPDAGRLQAARIFEAAKLALVRLWGEARAATVEPVSFKDGVLKMRTGNAAAFGEGRRMAATWRAETNRELGGAVVAEVVLVLQSGP